MENNDFKESPMSMHTTVMETYNKFLDLKDEIEIAFIRLNVVELGFLEGQYFNIRNDMTHNIQWMEQICQDCVNKNSVTEVSEPLAEARNWGVKVGKYYQILVCYKNGIARRAIVTR